MQSAKPFESRKAQSDQDVKALDTRNTSQPWTKMHRFKIVHGLSLLKC